MVVTVVMDMSDRAVGLVQGVVALHDVAVTGLMLILDVLSVVVYDFVGKLVFRMGLVKIKNNVLVWLTSF